MPKAIVVGDPNRADQRFISYINRFFCGGALDLSPEMYDLILRGFEEEGGSWYRLFRGSVDDVVLLKKLVKAQVKKQKS